MTSIWAVVIETLGLRLLHVWLLQIGILENLEKKLSARRKRLHVCIALNRHAVDQAQDPAASMRLLSKAVVGSVHDSIGEGIPVPEIMGRSFLSLNFNLSKNACVNYLAGHDIRSHKTGEVQSSLCRKLSLDGNRVDFRGHRGTIPNDFRPDNRCFRLCYRNLCQPWIDWSHHNSKTPPQLLMTMAFVHKMLPVWRSLLQTR